MIRSAREQSDAPVELRRLPYPYSAMLAICSDVDGTPDAATYAETMRFCNTTATTSMGEGLGLEVGNSMYFDMPDGQFAYWNTDDAGRDMLRALIRSGHVDVLHSYGELATRREHAERALAELDAHGCRLGVWVDHSHAPTNLGTDVTRGHGDEPDHPAYHADLTVAHGVRFVWRGRVTSVIAQDVPCRLGGVFHGRRPITSSRTLAKEAAKRVLAACGSRKYALHRSNRLLTTVALRDGRRVHEFMRTNPHWGGVSRGETARGIPESLAPRVLDHLAEREGAAVLYTHLGKSLNGFPPFDPATCEALRRAAEICRRRRILTTTTARLLRYFAVRDALRYTVSREGGGFAVTILGADDPVAGAHAPDPSELEGITFVAPAGIGVTITGPHGLPLPARTTTVGGNAYTTIPWRRLEFPDV
jgi:hypothetical protein